MGTPEVVSTTRTDFVGFALTAIRSFARDPEEPLTLYPTFLPRHGISNRLVTGHLLAVGRIEHP
jgi:hypothetical protein